MIYQAGDIIGTNQLIEKDLEKAIKDISLKIKELKNEV